MSSNSVPHQIIVLGGNFGGLGAVHYLLRKTIPSLQTFDKSKSFHVTLVTPNTHLFFKIGSPRALINSTLVPESKIWRPLSEGFSAYTPSQFTLIQAIATSLDPSQQNVTIATVGKPETETQQLHYDSLIISTGTTSASPLWTLHTEQNLTTAALKSMHEILPTVKTVLIAGGGPVGVETAGEIAAEYPSCKVTLLSGSARLLQRVKPETAARAQDYLEHKMQVEVIHNLRVAKSNDQVSNAATSTNASPTTVTLSDGSSKTTDLYIDATGGTPNSQFLPADWLDDSKRVLTGDAYFRVKGSDANKAAAVYVLGDMVAGSENTAIELDAMIPAVCSAVGIDVARKMAATRPEFKAAEGEAKPGLLRSLWEMVFGGNSGDPLVQKECKPLKKTMVVPIGRDGGVGQLLGWKMPSFFVKIVKGKSYLVEVVEPMLSGSKWK